MQAEMRCGCSGDRDGEGDRWMDRSIRHNDMMALPRHALCGVEIEKVQSFGRMHGRITNWRRGEARSLNCF
jgi:hypothetical protein